MWMKSLFLIFFSCHAVYAAIECPIDEKKPFPTSFSRQFHNRISVENGSVRKIFGDQSLFSVTIDDGIGQAFVSLVQEVAEQPAVLTVVTSSGLVQDLLVTSDGKVGEHLILKEAPEEADEQPFLSHDLHALTVAFLNEILSGKLPMGYGRRELQVGDKLELPKPLQASALSVFEGPYETIVLHKISNTGRKAVALSAETIKKPGDNWVFLDAQELDFTETALCIISKPKE